MAQLVVVRRLEVADLVEGTDSIEFGLDVAGKGDVLAHVAAGKHRAHGRFHKAVSRGRRREGCRGAGRKGIGSSSEGDAGFAEGPLDGLEGGDSGGRFAVRGAGAQDDGFVIVADEDVVVGGVEADQVDELEVVGAAPADQVADIANGDLLRELRGQ